MDVGAGPDHLARELQAKQCTVTLVNRVAPADVPPVHARSCSATSTPIRWTWTSSRVDVLLLLDVIEHLRSPERFLAALRRNLDHRPRTVDPHHAQRGLRCPAG